MSYQHLSPSSISSRPDSGVSFDVIEGGDATNRRNRMPFPLRPSSPSPTPNPFHATIPFPQPAWKDLAHPIGLRNMRVVIQDADDPWETRLLAPEDPMFRICVFVAHFGLALVNEIPSRRAMTLMAEEVLTYFRSYLREGEQMRQSQDRGRGISGFLAAIREHPPTITISNRVVGEGATVLARWYRPVGIENYNAKEAGQVRLNKTMFEYAVKTAEKSHRDTVKFHKFILMLGVGYVQQLCTLFAAYLIGDIERNSLSYTMGLRTFSTDIAEQLTTGEPGRIWQNHLMGNVLQLFETPSNPEDKEQAGDLFSVGTRSHMLAHTLESYVSLAKAELVNVGWIHRTLEYEWKWPVLTVTDGDGLPIRTRHARPIQAVWGVGCHKDFGDSDEHFRKYLNYVNMMPVTHFSEDAISEIRHMIPFPKSIFYGWPGCDIARIQAERKNEKAISGRI